MAKLKNDPRAQKLHTVLAENLRLARERPGLDISQDEAARRSRIAANTISRYERGQAVPGIAAIKALADVYGVTVDDLLSDRPSFMTSSPKSHPRATN